MPVFRFSHGQHFRWNGEDFTVNRFFAMSEDPHREAPVQAYVEFLDSQGQAATQPRSMLEQAFLEGCLIFLHRIPTDASHRIAQRDYAEKALDDDDEGLVEVARWRQWVIAPLKTEHRTVAAVKARAVEVKAGLTEKQRESGLYRVSKSTIYEWLRLDRQSDEDLRALIPKFKACGAPGKSRLDETVEHLLGSVISDLVLNAELGAPLDEVYDELDLRIREVNAERERLGFELLTLPGKTTVWERIAKLLREKRLKTLQDKEQRPARHSRTSTSRRQLAPTGEIEIDTTPVDIIALSDDRTVPIGRMNLVSAVDKATGYPFGRYIGFEPESHYASLECLYHGILPKINTRETYQTQHEWLSQGVPALVRIDRGKGYHNKHVRDAADLLGFDLDVLPPRTPYLKPFVERHFRLTNDGFHYLDGTTFSTFSKRGDYDSLQAAIFTCFEIDMLLHHFLLDLVAEKPLRGVSGISRATMWCERTAPPFEYRRPQSARLLRIALGWVEYRKLNSYGVEIDYIRYDDGKRLPRLREIWAGEKAKIKYHPGDLSRIYVFDPEASSSEDQYVEIPAVDREYTQRLSSWQHRVILNYLKETRREVDRSQLAQARRVVRATMETARQTTRSVKVRQRAERFFSTPPSAKPAIEAEENHLPDGMEDPPSVSSPVIRPEQLRIDPDQEAQWRIIGRSPRQVHLNSEE